MSAMDNPKLRKGNQLTEILVKTCFVAIVRVYFVDFFVLRYWRV